MIRFNQEKYYHTFLPGNMPLIQLLRNILIILILTMQFLPNKNYWDTINKAIPFNKI